MKTIAGTLLVITLAFSYQLTADDNRPVYLEIIELEADRFRVGVRVPASVPTFNQPEVLLSGSCSKLPLLALGKPDGGSAKIGMRVGIWQCERGLRGQSVTLDYPIAQPALPTVLRVSFLDGSTETQVLAPGENVFALPGEKTKSGVAGEYLWLGVHHIWAGADHLLFVVCLIFIAGSFGRILGTVTGFTIAHSITLALSATQIVQIPLPPVEALIALSVVFLAAEVVQGRKESLTWKFPFLVSAAFGLLHGLGFAAALNQIGLPKEELVTGLLFFNLGVESGQILFVVLIVAILVILKKAARQFTGMAVESKIRKLFGYGSGCLATLWFLNRVFAG